MLGGVLGFGWLGFRVPDLGCLGFMAVGIRVYACMGLGFRV